MNIIDRTLTPRARTAPQRPVIPAKAGIPSFVYPLTPNDA